MQAVARTTPKRCCRLRSPIKVLAAYSKRQWSSSKATPGCFIYETMFSGSAVFLPRPYIRRRSSTLSHSRRSQRPLSLALLIKCTILVQQRPFNRQLQEYHEHINAGRENRKPNSSKEFDTARSAIHEQVLSSAKLFASTSYTARLLEKYKIQVDAVQFDEAGQATHLDFMSAVVDQFQVWLVVLAGDPAQLGPISVTEIAKTNPFRSLLEMSALERKMYGEPHGAVFSLTINFRGHPSTIQMSSELFYGGRMIAFLRNWETLLAINVRKMLPARYANVPEQLH